MEKRGRETIQEDTPKFKKVEYMLREAEYDYWNTGAGINERISMLSEYFTYQVVNNSLQIYGEAGGVKEFKWVTMGDERVCDVCGPRDGHIYKPCEFLPSLPAHARCRCQWELIFGPEVSTAIGVGGGGVVKPEEPTPITIETEPLRYSASAEQYIGKIGKTNVLIREDVKDYEAKYDSLSNKIGELSPAKRESIEKVRLVSARHFSNYDHEEFEAAASFDPSMKEVTFWNQSTIDINQFKEESGLELSHEAGHGVWNLSRDDNKAEIIDAKYKFEVATKIEGGTTVYSREWINAQKTGGATGKTEDIGLDENFAESTVVFTEEDVSYRGLTTGTEARERYPRTYEAWKKLTGLMDIKVIK